MRESKLTQGADERECDLRARGGGAIDGLRGVAAETGLGLWFEKSRVCAAWSAVCRDPGGHGDPT